MKGFLLLLCVAVVIRATTCVEAEDLKIEPYSFKGESVWKMAPDDAIRFDWRAKKDTRMFQGDKVIGVIVYPEVVSQIVRSDSGKALLVLIQTERSSGGVDYSSLGIVKSKSADGFCFNRFLTEGGPSWEFGDKWISELGTVSDDGTVALLKVGVQSSRRVPYTVSYSWETWDLVAAKRLKTGLSVGPQSSRGAQPGGDE